jgi:hypothetical protein
MTWGTQSGGGDPSKAQSEAMGTWKLPFRLKHSGVNGNSPDLAPLAAGGWAAAWYRTRTDGRLDVALRRVP